MPSQEDKKDSIKRAKLSHILMEGETLLTSCNPIDLKDPIRDATPVPDNGLDRSFSIENKSYQFASDSESFCTDPNKGPFEIKGSIDKRLTDTILFKETKFSSPLKKGSRYRTNASTPIKTDPDDSLDIETGTLRRKGRFLHQNEKEPQNTIDILKEIPETSVPISILQGFKTAQGSDLYIQNEHMDKGRRSFDFLQSSTIRNVISKKPKKPAPREKEIQDIIKIYKKVKQEIFPIPRSEEEEYDLLSLFKWTWISNLPHIHEIQKRGGENQEIEIEKLLLLESKTRWKSNPKSVLRRIVEKDEAPAIYMKVLVVEKRPGHIRISDGLHSLWAKLDECLESVSDKISVGMILQVACSNLLTDRAISIWEASMEKNSVLQLYYNGVKPCTYGPLGYQSTMGYIRELSSIRLQGGFISTLMLKVTKHIETMYLVDIKGVKTLIDEDRIDSTLQRVEKTIENLNKTREETLKEYESVKLNKYKRYEVVCEYSHDKTPGILSLWELDFDEKNLRIGKRYLFFMLTTPKRAKVSDKILLTSNVKTCYRLI